jgi:hypothetical protein
MSTQTFDMKANTIFINYYIIIRIKQSFELADAVIWNL